MPVLFKLNVNQLNFIFDEIALILWTEYNIFNEISHVLAINFFQALIKYCLDVNIATLNGCRINLQLCNYFQSSDGHTCNCYGSMYSASM